MAMAALPLQAQQSDTQSNSQQSNQPAAGQPAQSAASGVSFTQAQATSGRELYRKNCAACHGSQLQGGAGAALAGNAFSSKWSDRTVKDLYTFVHQSMPMSAPGSLSDQQYADIIAYVLQRNDFQPGDQQLTAQSMPDAKIQPPGQAAASAGGRGVAVAQQGSKPQVDWHAGETQQAKSPGSTGPTQAELDRADDDMRSWLMYNKGYEGHRYSKLSQIDTHTAKDVRAVCAFQTGESGTFQTGPVMYDRTLYFTTMHSVYAVDATNCKRRWDYEWVPPGADYSYNGTNRGVAVAQGRVIRGTQDGYLLALDARTGDLLWSKHILDASKAQFFAAAPIVWNGMIFLGQAGGDWGARGAMLAFDLKDGKELWRFDLVPTGAEKGAETWQEPQSAMHGGASSWTTYSLDLASGTIYVPVGNPGPDFYKAVRPGSNLFTDSVVALDAKSGKLKWWYQLVAGDYHDWDTTSVAAFESHGRKLIATAGKDGVLRVLDRSDGKEQFKIPVTTIENVEAPITEQGTRYCPGTLGGVEWNGPAYSPQTNLLYVNAIDWCVTSRLAPKEPKYSTGMEYAGLANGFGTFDPVEKSHGWTNAIDATTGKMAWRYKSPTPMVAGITPTAGGVVLTGDMDGNFLVMDAKDGKTLYRWDTGGPIAAGVITYEDHGKQYVAVASGNNSRTAWMSTGAATVFLFALP
jgi:PQQ-dependent dehydrogenase (methanol/ethanol family)